MAKKRTNGEGSYSQRADGRWCWKMMDGYTPEGKPNTVVIYGKTQKEVKEKVKQYQRDKEDGLKIDRKLTFSAWADTWFESLSGVEESTKEGYRYTARKLKEVFFDQGKGRPLGDVSAYKKMRIGRNVVIF